MCHSQLVGSRCNPAFCLRELGVTRVLNEVCDAVPEWSAGWVCQQKWH